MRRIWLWLGVMLVAAAALSLLAGSRWLSPATVWAALTAPDPADPAHLILRGLRLPRLAAGGIAGAALGVAGALMQALTRNPLAEPGLMGVNAGAGLAVVLGAALGLGLGPLALAMPGAALAALAVFVLGGGMLGGIGPARLALAGMALNAVLFSAITAVVLTSASALDDYRFWVIGTLADAGTRPLAAMAPVVALAVGLSLLIGPALDTLALGDDAARALGLRLGAIRVAVLGLVAALAGAAVVVAGPLVFMGLMAPQLARLAAGPGARRLIAASALLGAIVLILCDVAGRLILPQAEVRAGTMTCLLGGIVFVAVVRRIRLGAVE